MLYESGAVSNAELFILYKCSRSPHLVREFEEVETMQVRVIIRLVILETLLEMMATTPRSLMSSCRLVISHCLDPRGRRQRDVETLPVLSLAMKRYVMFQDLTHPDYGKEEEEEEDAARFDYMPSLRAAIDENNEAARLALLPHQRWFVTSSYPVHGPLA
jgi:hypothetical protein